MPVTSNTMGGLASMSSGLTSHQLPNGLVSAPLQPGNSPPSVSTPGLSELCLFSLLQTYPHGQNKNIMYCSTLIAQSKAGDAGGDESDFLSRLTPNNKDYIAKQQRWLLFLRHCAKCNAPNGECQYGQSCSVAKALWRHILECSLADCTYPR